MCMGRTAGMCLNDWLLLIEPSFAGAVLTFEDCFKNSNMLIDG